MTQRPHSHTMRLMQRSRIPMVSMTVRLPPAMIEQVNAAADEQVVYPADIIRIAVNQYLNELERQRTPEAS